MNEQSQQINVHNFFTTVKFFLHSLFETSKVLGIFRKG